MNPMNQVNSLDEEQGPRWPKMACISLNTGVLQEAHIVLIHFLWTNINRHICSRFVSSTSLPTAGRESWRAKGQYKHSFSSNTNSRYNNSLHLPFRSYTFFRSLKTGILLFSILCRLLPLRTFNQSLPSVDRVARCEVTDRSQINNHQYAYLHYQYRSADSWYCSCSHGFHKLLCRWC